jgi:hypothetical protein
MPGTAAPALPQAKPMTSKAIARASLNVMVRIQRPAGRLAFSRMPVTPQA